jgi:ABC-2 type transport system ATP-binding protein
MPPNASSGLQTAQKPMQQTVMMDSTPIPQNTIVQVSQLVKEFKVTKSYTQLLRHPFKSKVLTALAGVSFSVTEGRCLGILGPNGAGKTTLMKILSTLITPTSGHVEIDGIDVEENPDKVKKIIGCVISDERSFFWRLTGRQNLHFFATLNNLSGKEEKTSITRLIELTQLAGHIEKPFQAYSSGMKQKLAIARALLTDPKILLFDEPSRNLDPLFRERFLTFLKETVIGRMKKTVIIATHNTQEAQQLCHEILVLDNGEVLLNQNMKDKPDIGSIFSRLAAC